MQKFKAGDRVRIPKDLSEGFLHPFKKFAREGREGLVVNILTHTRKVEYRVLFDFRNGPQAFYVHEDMLELAPRSPRR